MPNKRIPNLDAILGPDTAPADSFVVFDASLDTTKRITRPELATGLVSDLAGNGLESDGAGKMRTTFLQAGTSAVARTAQSKMRDIVSVKDFGAVGDGVTDDTAAIQAAINYVSSNKGGYLLFPPGNYVISSTLNVIESNVFLMGSGGGTPHDVGTQNQSACTQLTWSGPLNGTMIKFESPAGASNQKKTGGGVSGFYLGANNVAGIGLQIVSWSSALFEYIVIMNPRIFGIDVDVVSSLGEARDVQNCRFSRIFSRQWEVTGQVGGLLRLGASFIGANPSLNVFEMLDCQYTNGNAYELNDCDNNLFIRCRAFRAPGGTGNGIVCNGSNVSSGQIARANIFYHFTGTGATTIICRGTTSFTHPSYGNSFFMIDSDNGTPAPTIETGSNAVFTFTSGFSGQINAIGLAVGESTFSAIQARALKSAIESVFVYNGSDAHMALGDNSSNKWGISIESSTGNLRATRVSGSGSFDLGNGAPVKIFNQNVSVGAADSGGVGYKLLRIPN